MAFNIGFYAYAIIGHTRADQLLPQLLMEQFDTLPIQCYAIIGHTRADQLLPQLLLYPPQTLFVVGYTVFTLSVRACIRPSVTVFLIT